jgi:hypothetical protein
MLTRLVLSYIWGGLHIRKTKGRKEKEMFRSVVAHAFMQIARSQGCMAVWLYSSGAPLPAAFEKTNDVVTAYNPKTVDHRDSLHLKWSFRFRDRVQVP